MLKRYSHILLCFLLIILANYALAIAQEIIKLSTTSVAGLPRMSVNVHIHGSKETAVYEGISLGDLIRKFGAPAGEAIHGANLCLAVIVKAADGYQVVFALPELDPSFNNKVVLLADRRNGEPLSGKEGPFRLIVPDEARQARWVRQVTTIELREIK